MTVGDMWRIPYYFIRAYQRFLSPCLPATCRFTPTCSAYAAEALRTQGLARGARLALRRILRCHPWHAGGYDPVPTRDASPATSEPLITGER